MSWLKETFDFFKNTRDPLLRTLFRLTIIVFFIVIVFFGYELVTGNRLFLNGKLFGVQKDSIASAKKTVPIAVANNIKDTASILVKKKDTTQVQIRKPDSNAIKANLKKQEELIDIALIAPDTSNIHGVLNFVAKENKIYIADIFVQVHYRYGNLQIKRYSDGLILFLKQLGSNGNIWVNEDSDYEKGLRFDYHKTSGITYEIISAKIGDISESREINVFNRDSLVVSLNKK